MTYNQLTRLDDLQDQQDILNAVGAYLSPLDRDELTQLQALHYRDLSWTTYNLPRTTGTEGELRPCVQMTWTN